MEYENKLEELEVELVEKRREVRGGERKKRERGGGRETGEKRYKYICTHSLPVLCYRRSWLCWRRRKEGQE